MSKNTAKKLQAVIFASFRLKLIVLEYATGKGIRSAAHQSNLYAYFNVMATKAWLKKGKAYPMTSVREGFKGMVWMASR